MQAFSSCREQWLGAYVVVVGSVIMAVKLKSAGLVVVVHGPSSFIACEIHQNQGSNPCPLHWQVDSYPQDLQGGPHLEIWKEIYIFEEDRNYQN